MGSSSYALSDAAAASTATDNFSLEAWIRPDAYPTGDAGFAAYNGTDAGGWGIGINAAGYVVGLYGSSAWLITTKRVDLGSTYHLVLVRSAGTTTIYVNGAPYTPTNPTAIPVAPTAHFAIAAELRGHGHLHQGFRVHHPHGTCGNRSGTLRGQPRVEHPA